MLKIRHLSIAAIALLSAVACAEKPPSSEIFSDCNIDDMCFERQRSNISSWKDLAAYYHGAQDRVDVLGTDPDSRIKDFETSAAVCSALPNGLVRIHCEARLQPQDCAELSKQLDAQEDEFGGPAPDWRLLDACLVEELRKREGQPWEKIRSWCAGQSEEMVQICLQSYARLARDKSICKTLDDPRVHQSCIGEAEALASAGDINQCTSQQCQLAFVKYYRSGLNSVTIDCEAENSNGERLTDLSRDCEQWSARAQAIQQNDLSLCADYTCVVWFVTEALAKEQPTTGQAADQLAKRFCPEDTTFPANQCRNALFNTLAVQRRDQELCVEGYWNPAECQIRLLEMGVPLADCESVGQFASTDLYRQRTQQACQMLKAKLSSKFF